jgi:hypothetical protein
MAGTPALRLPRSGLVQFSFDSIRRDRCMERHGRIQTAVKSDSLRMVT